MEVQEDINKKPDISVYKIERLPPSLYYIPNFITEAEEASILQKIPPNRWTNLAHRRLQVHPSTLTINNTLLGAPLPSWLMNPILPRFQELGIFTNTPHGQPNHVLINEYRPGEGIMPHEDGIAYAGIVATVSLGGALCLDVSSKAVSHAADDADINAPERSDGAVTLPTRIFQEPRSLLVTMDRAYTDLLHGIAAVEVDGELSEESVANWTVLGDETRGLIAKEDGKSVRGTRVSLTYRDVKRVSGAARKAFGLAR